MSSLKKLRTPHVLKWVSLLCTENCCSPSKSSLCLNGSYQLRFCTTGTAVNLGKNLGELAKRSRVVRREAQAALSEYFHSTRGFQITDAENMSKNAPEFFDSLVKRVDVCDAKVGRSVARFLRYHPVNEFEPFFESIGLKPSEYLSLLPRDLMFLNDDQLLLENYNVLCNYGIARNRVGKIYKEAREVFRYEYGVLQSKLRCFENLGLKQSTVAKIIASSPHLLRGNVDEKFVEVLAKLEKAGIEYEWLEEHMCEEDSYNWKNMLELICLLSEIGLSDEQLGELFRQHPDLLLECSGRLTFCLFGLLMKFGSTLDDVRTAILQFPQISVLEFTNNLCNCYKFLIEINMAVQDIGSIVRSYPTVLGSCELKKVDSLMSSLNCGKNRLCEMVKDDPYILEKWVLGVRVDRLQEPKRVLRVRMMKTKFLLSLGFVEKSKEMEKALKVVRGKGVELQERFDSLLNVGFSREQVIQMVRVSPQILNQSKDVIETKIGLFIKELGLPVSDLLTHPKLVSYNIQRVKLRLSMYKWLKDKGLVHPKLALSTLMASSDKRFVTTYVNAHPGAPEYWQRLKKEIYSD
ncbi:Transcription termination factor MTEF18, mitochondrial [Sesamum alatum]|uniref:Transcription termination factor MTEF18, mitochondrial n=1 Tax=Sesamum alatum TaxID=300844 RepID=A0AAE1XJC2_9LAMI|nr:Transcription termination factor MTEF18, mitochondrial [Sesamum alatum]